MGSVRNDTSEREDGQDRWAVCETTRLRERMDRTDEQCTRRPARVREQMKQLNR